MTWVVDMLLVYAQFLPKFLGILPDLIHLNLMRVVEEVMDYRTSGCGSAKPSAKTWLGFPSETRVNQEHKMKLSGRYVDFGTLFRPSFQQVIPTRFLHEV